VVVTSDLETRVMNSIIYLITFFIRINVLFKKNNNKNNTQKKVIE